MSVTILKVGKKEYVIVPKRRYDQLLRIRRDAIDAEIARRGREAYESGTMLTISHDELSRSLDR